MADKLTGLVAILTGETGRWTAFWEKFAGLDFPGRVKVKTYKSADITAMRNQAMEEADEQGADWLWFLDDDHTYEPDILDRLLAHEGDIIQPVVLRRKRPFLTVVQRLDPHLEPPALITQSLHELGTPADGAVEVDTLGMGGTLIRRSAWARMARPWFEAGQGRPGKLMEDVTFSARARDAGARCYIALDVPMGHLGVVEIWPVFEEGQWMTSLRVDDLDIRAPAVRRKPGETGTYLADRSVDVTKT